MEISHETELQDKDVSNYTRSFAFRSENETENESPDGLLDEASRTITISASSEEPFLRKFGYEILSHQKNDVDLSFLNSGNAPLLRMHDPDEQIGVITKAWLVEAEKRIYATVKFSNNHLDVLTDVKDGIKNNVSIGYKITGMTQETIKNDIPVYRCAFRPHEISIVSVPADETIGTNRSAETDLQNEAVPQPLEISEKAVPSEDNSAENTRKSQPIQKETKNMETQDNNLDIEVALKAERSRVSEISDIASRFGLETEATEFIRSGKSVAEFKDLALAKKEDVRKVDTVSAPAFVKSVGDKEQDFSIGRAFVAASNGNWNDAGFEKEKCQDMARSSGKTFDQHKLFIDPNMNVRAGAVGTSNGGAELVGTTHMGNRFIDQLYAKTISNQLGFDQMLGLQGNVQIPVITSGTAPAWGAETAMASEQSPGTAIKTLSPNQLTVLAKHTRQLLVQSMPQIDRIITQDILKQIALAVDTAAINGAGGTAPTGILQTAGIGAVALGTNGAAPSYATVNALIAAVETANALDGSLAFLTNPKATAKLRTTLKDSANTASGYIMPESGSTLIGYNTAVSTIVPSNLVKGSSGSVCSALLFGNFNDAIIAQWGPIELVVNPYKENAFIHYEAYSWWDVLVKRAESFAAIKDMITT